MVPERVRMTTLPFWPAQALRYYTRTSPIFLVPFAAGTGFFSVTSEALSSSNSSIASSALAISEAIEDGK
eukprot:CAMPEP_0181214524 /NCGR_PEP_ID=MMETSP1096-20121128/25505_1 /TAXON_ID=156174 ORGANISM="Chrysochromulina ericina, Strain CCMP281" /NCGR_SAMPLE_ID=MMETSP1096 /ASSEMBLY_ACC=CAM_ASM_000453 /LENGTH=69 /DNA_ID=CAMNT_0023306277 /DNA_START=188 /DNA_END=397 /DNA_ORIENTATION=-